MDAKKIIMKTTLPVTIETKEQAIAFLTELHRNGEAYHPEDDAKDIYTGQADISRLFTDEEADRLNDLMTQIYDIDENNGNHYTPKYDPCETLNILNALDDLNNRNLLSDMILNKIKREVFYIAYLTQNPHTRNWELSVSDGENIVGKYDYSRWGDVAKDIEKLREFEILIEEEV